MSAYVQIVWDRRAIARLGIKGLEPQLMRMGQYLRTKVVKNISVPTSTKGPSKPAEFPHADTGRLRQSIFCRKDPGPMVNGVPTSIVKVGTNLKYGLYHEYVSGRSFLRRTLMEEMPKLRAMIRGGQM